MLESLIRTDSGATKEPVPGGFYEGGYYAGRIKIGAEVYRIIVSPKDQGEVQRSWKTNLTNTAGSASLNNGLANTQAILAATGTASHHAAYFCGNLILNGYDDWYLPSVDELELCYRNLKPSNNTNDFSAYGRPHTVNGYNPASVPVGAAYTASNPSVTNVESFITGGSNSFVENWYWTSTQATTGGAWFQNFKNGEQNYYSKTGLFYVRAVRRVKIS